MKQNPNATEAAKANQGFGKDYLSLWTVWPSLLCAWSILLMTKSASPIRAK